MAPRNEQEAKRIELAREIMANQEVGTPDDGRVILVDENTTLVVNQPGVNPFNWPKKAWRK